CMLRYKNGTIARMMDRSILVTFLLSKQPCSQHRLFSKHWTLVYRNLISIGKYRSNTECMQLTLTARQRAHLIGSVTIIVSSLPPTIGLRDAISSWSMFRR